MKSNVELFKSYRFSDITVYMKMQEGKEYVNITDYSVISENEVTELDSSSPFVIMFHSFYENSVLKTTRPYICNLTFNELLLLAGIKDKSFIKRFGIDENVDNKEILALLCAKKILDYNYGRVEKNNEETYEFYRQQTYVNEGKKKRKKSLIFEKKFYRG